MKTTKSPRRNSAPEPLLKAALRTITTWPGTYGELAHECGLSESYLQKLYAGERTGMSQQAARRLAGVTMP
jgi:hypothetical protein